MIRLEPPVARMQYVLQRIRSRWLQHRPLLRVHDDALLVPHAIGHRVGEFLADVAGAADPAVRADLLVGDAVDGFEGDGGAEEAALLTARMILAQSVPSRLTRTVHHVSPPVRWPWRR